jgi:hypothetical protein
MEVSNRYNNIVCSKGEYLICLKECSFMILLYLEKYKSNCAYSKGLDYTIFGYTNTIVKLTQSFTYNEGLIHFFLPSTMES